MYTLALEFENIWRDCGFEPTGFFFKYFKYVSSILLFVHVFLQKNKACLFYFIGLVYTLAIEFKKKTSQLQTCWGNRASIVKLHV